MINFITCFTLRILRNAKLQLFSEMAKLYFQLKKNGLPLTY